MPCQSFDVCNQRFGKLLTICQIGSNHLDLVRLKIHLWPAVKIPVVHGAIVDREAINIEGEEFLDDMQPGFVDSDLASLPRGTLHKVYDWRIKIDLADQRAVEECDDLARG
jgi:hypothetical protein